MVFIGLPWSVVPFPLFYVQALVACSVFSDPSLLPAQSDMVEWLSNFELSNTQVDSSGNKELDVRSYHYLGGNLQFVYMTELIRDFLRDDKKSNSALLR